MRYYTRQDVRSLAEQHQQKYGLPDQGNAIHDFIHEALGYGIDMTSESEVAVIEQGFHGSSQWMLRDRFFEPLYKKGQALRDRTWI